MNTLRVDSLLLLSALAVSAVAAVRFDLFETVVAFAHAHEEYEVDEIFVVLIIMSFGIGLFAWRRVRELHAEIRLRVNAENRVRHLAMHDPLTGVANRSLFLTELRRDLARAAREGRQVALLALDLDKFKQINDVYGHGVGDALLVEIATRMKRLVRESDTIARLGGDEFAIIQEDGEQPGAAQTLAARVVDTLAEPYDLKGHHFITSVSIGIALSNDTLRDGAELLRAADVALYRAKDDGRSTFRLHDPGMDEWLQTREAMTRELHEAAAKRQLTLRYQPQFGHAGHDLMGFEALLRWQHPERGMIAPNEFIPIAEQTGLINEIGAWVLGEACRTASTWPEDLAVAVNVSAVQFRQRNFVSVVRAAFEDAGLPPQRLELEITESVLIQDAESALRMLEALKELGVRIVMDDFGTGYSSLSNLRKFPFDKIKIDGAFSSDPEHNPQGTAIMRAAIAMGSSLGVITLAEGVETESQLQVLSLEGCDLAQGFLLGRPMTGREALMMASRTVGEPIVAT